MKFNQRYLKVVLPVSALILLLTGCNSGGFTLGGKYLDSDMQTVIIDTCTVRMTTVAIDSLSTTNLGLGLVGRYSNSDFGTVTATTYLSYTHPGTYDLPDVVFFDSVALVMHLNGSYLGDTTRMQEINVYKLTDSITPPDNDTYYNVNSVPYEASPLVSYSFAPRPSTRPSGTTTFPYLEKTSYFTLRLPDDFGQDLFDLFLNDDERLENDEDFRSYFRGLAIAPGTNDSTVLGFDVDADTSMAIRVYYHYTEERRRKGKIDIKVDDSRNFYGVQHDRTDHPFQELDGSTGKELRTSSSDNKGLIQALSATYVKIEFPFLNNLLEMGDFGAVLDAALIIYPAESSFSKTMPLPSKLSLYESDSKDATVAQVTSSSGQPLTGNLYRDELYDSKTYYSYDITSFMKDQLGVWGLNKRNLQLSQPSDTLSKCLNTVVIGDQNYKKEGTRLIVKYLIYENK
jgi:hypothetical protein